MGELLYLYTNKLSFIERAKHVDISTRQGKREMELECAFYSSVLLLLELAGSS